MVETNLDNFCENIFNRLTKGSCLSLVEWILADCCFITMLSINIRISNITAAVNHIIWGVA